MPLNNNTDVNGNKDAKNLLQQFVNMATEQPVGYAVVIGAMEPNQYMVGFSGTVELEQIAVEGLKKAQSQLEANILNRTLPDSDPLLDDSYVCYNICVSPLSYDFVTWIISQDMKRKKANVEAPLKVGFWMGRDGKSGLSGMPDRVQMFNKVCRPALNFIGAIEDPKACSGKFDNFFSYKFIVDLYKEGIPITKLRTNTVLTDVPKSYVTITLRETNYWPHRNSKIDEWMMFAKYLTNKGNKVIFIRDTAKADEPVEGYLTYPAASKDMDTRCALYQQAKANLFVTNGPASFGLFGDRPFLVFLETDDNSAYNASRPEYYRQCAGIDPDKLEQYPWCTKQQVFTWKPDYYTHMVTEWEKLGLD